MHPKVQIIFPVVLMLALILLLFNNPIVAQTKQRFIYPKMNDLLINICAPGYKVNDAYQPCGKRATVLVATEFCKAQGFKGANDFVLYTMPAREMQYINWNASNSRWQVTNGLPGSVFQQISCSSEVVNWRWE
ncbi:hypothetical protein Syn7502_02509 [Synechococcus sp. PCC 7502]|uniref:hypothetical protein n=1 Tax=Synechococcus sp. PCC 7502 TaxID=1173263 RepID=UPI00029FAB05|nr:hypothetical protein [Synechococcus sp. PCC 7502]AFY74482.1 hypothetical protein Syn7502_02509 [Synechococcus sp. PCC 7502]